MSLRLNPFSATFVLIAVAILLLPSCGPSDPSLDDACDPSLAYASLTAGDAVDPVGSPLELRVGDTTTLRVFVVTGTRGYFGGWSNQCAVRPGAAWTSANPEIANVAPDGKDTTVLHASSSGTTTITAVANLEEGTALQAKAYVKVLPR